MRLARSLLAVVVGYLIFAFSAVALFRLSGRDPHAPRPAWFMLLATVSGMIFSGAGGYCAAMIAPSRGRGHAAIVAVLVALGAAVSLGTSPATDATWSQWGALLLMAPSAWVGGRLRGQGPVR
jgi:hypothetical protein